MSARVARYISILLHPVWMPAYTLFLIFHLANYPRFSVAPAFQSALYGIVLLNTIVIPLFITYMLFQRGWIKTFDMEEREERFVPYLANALCLLFSYFLLKKLQAPHIFSQMMLGAFAAVIFAVIINLRWKISIHMIGIGGLAGVLFGMSSLLIVDLKIPIIATLLVAGILGTARLALQAHHPAQIYAGFAIGWLCEFVMLSV
jgi:hypothetical protein